jgi:flagellar protein FlaH
MARIIVAEDERDIRESVVDTLFDRGYDVLETKNGQETYDLACKEIPDLILLDVMMPELNGFQVLEKLKENPLTNAIPVIMLTAVGALEGEQNAMNLGVPHYVSKPFEPGHLMATIRVALREAGAISNSDGDSKMVWRGSTLLRSANNGNATANLIPLGTQLAPLEKKMSGGLRMGSLSLIEGPSATGKSVISQYLANGAIANNHKVAYFTSQHTPRSLESQVSSIAMDWSEALKLGKLVVYPLQPPVTGRDSVPLMEELALELERIQNKFAVVIIDAITNLAGTSQEQAIIGFFSTCKRLTNMGITIVLVTHSVAFNTDLLHRIYSLCETHLNLRTGKILDNVIRIVTVVKLDDVDLTRDNEVSFGVEAGLGITIIPYSQAKA